MNVPKKLQMQQSVCVLCGDSSIRFAGDCENYNLLTISRKNVNFKISLQTFEICPELHELHPLCETKTSVDKFLDVLKFYSTQQSQTSK